MQLKYLLKPHQLEMLETLRGVKASTLSWPRMGGQTISQVESKTVNKSHGGEKTLIVNPKSPTVSVKKRRILEEPK